jgi:hypothetical protein
MTLIGLISTLIFGINLLSIKSQRDLLEGNDKMIGYAGIINTLTINEKNKLRREVEPLTDKQDEIQKIKENMSRK